MAGAHLDSVADGPGVNDNGSGVSALLALANRLAAGAAPARHDPPRLLDGRGARPLRLAPLRRAARPARARRGPRAYLNFDMVASPNAVIETYGSGATETALRRALDARGPLPGRASIAGASDHAPFVRARASRSAACSPARPSASTRATPSASARALGPPRRPVLPPLLRPPGQRRPPDAADDDRRGRRGHRAPRRQPSRTGGRRRGDRPAQQRRDEQRRQDATCRR